ncbi:MAG: SIS domain-containing protein [Flammeovirgaceae bacterium]
MNENIITALKEHSRSLDKIDRDGIIRATKLIQKALKDGNKIFWCGNGGSASQANHLSAELIGGMFKDKKAPFKSICLNVDTAFISAWSNDDSFDNVFIRQLEALADSGDILVALSTSGNSQNIINATKFCKQNDIKIISFTGFDGGLLKNNSDLNINIPVNCTQRVQEMHIFIGHIICDIIEKDL